MTGTVYNHRIKYKVMFWLEGRKWISTIDIPWCAECSCVPIWLFKPAESRPFSWNTAINGVALSFYTPIPFPMQDPSSYTFKLSDRAGTNIYSPYGDGLVSSGWRALPNSHNTIAPNASLQLSWKGTAITINGYVNSSQGPPAYMLSLDGQSPTQEVVDGGRTNAEVLLSKTGLPLAYHTIVLSNIAGGNLTVKGLQLSISTGANRSVFFNLHSTNQ